MSNTSERSALIQVSTASISLISSVIMAEFVSGIYSRGIGLVLRSCGKDSPCVRQDEDTLRDPPEHETLGLSTPYRRTIFCLSLSDIMQSLAILTGPWLYPKTTPQSVWGLGNEQTCALNGFFYTFGMSVVHMYMLTLCIYYVSKLKFQMTDIQYAERIEGKLHKFIIAINFIILTPCLVLGLFHPSPMGTMCAIAVYPTGCRYDPDLYGVCDNEDISITDIMLLLHAVVIPLVSILGIVICLTVIAYGIRRPIPESQRDTYSFRRNRYLRRSEKDSIDDLSEIEEERGHFISSITDHFEVWENFLISCDGTTSISTKERKISMNNERNGSLRLSYHKRSNRLQCDGPENLQGKEDVEDVDHPLNEHQTVSKIDPIDETVVFGEIFEQSSDSHLSQSHQLPMNRRESLQSQNSYPHPVHDVVGTSERDQGGGTPCTEFSEGINARRRKSWDGNRVTILNTAREELLVQVISYTFLFGLVSIPPMTANLVFLRKGNSPILPGFRFLISLLNPLGGLFNILVYTRPKVTSFRRKQPGISRIKAFWLVLRAGGEVPDI